MVQTMAEWIAPAATMIAAMMTAANLGARFTGWGFVVFLIGSLCWSLVGFTTGQANLLTTNIFLTLVNAIGIWRWLGRQRVYEDGGKSAVVASSRSAAPTLFSATSVCGFQIVDEQGEKIGKAVEALLECATGQISYIVIASSEGPAIAEALRAVPRASVAFGCEQWTLRITKEEFEALPPLEDGEWPAHAPANVRNDDPRR
ncbi:PRC-barrel domain-containing protein [Flavisphingomonas formosensis]|uniref:PRC-barrel domain-containing protein n=1 Tax=Flavisphingomonas formosensis TaxID=861534 RepID=UPI001E3C2C76|nr:PRC-barrel domain-containing protein [Sphingomonas formosensis]